MMRLEFHPAARDEVRRARRRYASENPVAAVRFVEELRRMLALVREAPLRWPRVDEVRRRLVFDVFPYALIYRVVPEKSLVWILAVAHQHRRPGYWSRR
jgi:toxin ParE2